MQATGLAVNRSKQKNTSQPCNVISFLMDGGTKPAFGALVWKIFVSGEC